MILPATRLDGRNQEHISLTTNSFYTTILHSSNTNTAVSCSLRGRQNSALIATVVASPLILGLPMMLPHHLSS